MDSENLDNICLNCGSVLSGGYCADCGQKSGAPLKPFRKLLADGADFLFEINLKVFRTVTLLIIKPGVVISGYLSGKRQEFTAPLRLCLILFTIFVAGIVTYAESTDPAVITGALEIPIWIHSLGLAVGMLFPVAMALCLKILYPFELFQKHFVFCLYYISAGIVIGGPFWIIQKDYPLVASMAGVILLIYLGVALRQVYKETWWIFGLKLAVVVNVFLLVVPIGVVWLITIIGAEITRFSDSF